MALAGLNPIVNQNTSESGFIVDEGTNILLHQLFLDSSTEYIFIELDAMLFFV